MPKLLSRVVVGLGAVLAAGLYLSSAASAETSVPAVEPATEIINIVGTGISLEVSLDESGLLAETSVVGSESDLFAARIVPQEGESVVELRRNGEPELEVTVVAVEVVADDEDSELSATDRLNEALNNLDLGDLDLNDLDMEDLGLEGLKADDIDLESLGLDGFGLEGLDLENLDLDDLGLEGLGDLDGLEGLGSNGFDPQDFDLNGFDLNNFDPNDFDFDEWKKNNG